MSKLELMKRFMETFVGNGFHLIVKDKNYFRVHTIEVFQKTDDSCPLKEIPMGDYFLRLSAKDENNREASILCDWDEELIKNLLEHAVYAREAGYNAIMMQRSPQSPNSWLLLWGDKLENAIKPKTLRKLHLPYIS
jgi:hypothetical protein